MSVKNVVKVMSFYSLLRIDKARKKAEKFSYTGMELTKLIDRIIFNRNIVLDKNVLEVDETKPVLSIYIANDYGFCGNFNSMVSSQLRRDKDSYKIIVGSKINYSDDKTLLKLPKSEFYDRFDEIEDILYKSVVNMEYSKITVFYNHYYTSTSFDFLEKQLFPVEFEENTTFEEDFVIETDVLTMLSNLVSFFICYELRMCESISYAAENVMRKQITSEALKKIEEKEEEDNLRIIKEKKEEIIKKSVENYKKTAL